jgi:hypothetical protein
MHHTVLGLVCLIFVCISHGNAAAHEPASRDTPVASPGAPDAGRSRPLSATLCKEADCAIDPPAGNQRPRPRYVLTPKPWIASAIAQASAANGVDLDYMLRTAALESSFDPFKEVATSSAKGLYQFVEQTWLFMLRDIGDEFGLDKLADAIVLGDSGKLEVADAGLRNVILWLRRDPWLSANFAAAFTRRNTEFLTKALGRVPDSGELYLAHVMGGRGAAELITLVETKPGADACKQFARAAKANKTIFYNGRKARSAEEVYLVLTSKYFEIPVYAEEADLRVLTPRSTEPTVPPPAWLPGEHDEIHAVIPGRHRSRVYPRSANDRVQVD